MESDQLVRRYERELALVYGTAGWLSVAALLLGLASGPLWLGSYGLYVGALAGIQAIAATGLNVLVGFTGQMSLGHAGFVAVGAYAEALLAGRLGWPFAAALPAAALACSALGVVVALPALRLTGPYLAIATMGFGVAIQQVLVNWPEVSGGRTGLTVPAPALGRWVIDSDASRFELVLIAAVGLVLAAHNLARSYVGRALMAVRDSDLAAQVMGIRLSTYKTLAFAIAAAYAGAAGALMAAVLGYLEPSMFTLFDSIYYLGMVVLGGAGSVPGPVAGAVLLTASPQVLSRAQEWLPVGYGAIILLVTAVEPGGMYGRWLRIKRYLKSWPL